MDFSPAENHADFQYPSSRPFLNFYDLYSRRNQGYHYEHCFSYDWNAMKGYHYLMRIGRTINVLAQYCESLVSMFIEKGVRGFIDFVRETLTGPWLDIDWIRARLSKPYQLRLI
jgi:hypothetical protein